MLFASGDDFAPDRARRSDLSAARAFEPFDPQRHPRSEHHRSGFAPLEASGSNAKVEAARLAKHLACAAGRDHDIAESSVRVDAESRARPWSQLLHFPGEPVRR